MYNVACVGKKKMSTGYWWGKIQMKRDHLEDLHVDGRMGQCGQE